MYACLLLRSRPPLIRNCSAPCIGSCPEGIDIPERTAGAHRLLTLG